MNDDLQHLGELARRLVERLEANQERQFVIPGGEGPTVTMRVSDYDALRDRLDELTRALDQIQRLDRDVAGWKPRAVEANRIASEALRRGGEG